MNITTEPSQEVWHDIQEPGAYEWWYFDAEDAERGISVVAIWFAGFPFSPSYTEEYDRWRADGASPPPHPSNYAGFSFQLYENGRETINFIREGGASLFTGSKTGAEVAFENNRFVHDPLKDEYRLDIDFTFPARRKRVQGTLHFIQCRRLNFNKKDGNHEGAGPCHQWHLSVPKAEVRGGLEITESEGIGRSVEIQASGYHDHNLGTMPMQEYISRWYWGRAFSDRVDLVYYVIFFRDPSFPPLTLLMLNDNQSGGALVRDKAEFRESRFCRGIFAPLHGRVLDIHDGDVRMRINQKQVLDSGPFYLRFSSDISLDFNGSSLTGIRGISEFLNPDRLQSPLMRFFIRSRIWREGEDSLMYREYNRIKDRLDWFKR
ncbi:MAG: carotenoid 1,2-hydratase [Chlorobium phaeovibrioides]|nr:carotenoid 1,2-hydratase [Chlorobium phaeovibrioides]